MGYQDRDYNREEGVNDPLGLGMLSMTAKIIIVTVLVFLVDMFFFVEKKDGLEPQTINGQEVLVPVTREVHNVEETLALKAKWFVKPWLFYGLLSHGFVHDPNDIRHILFNMLGLFFFGRAIEDRWGGLGLLRYYLVSIVFCGLIWSGRQFVFGNPLASCVGASGGVTACIILFCLQNPKSTVLLMFFPMPAWLAGIVIVGINMLGINPRPEPNAPQVAFDAHLAGAAFALVVWALKIDFGRMHWLDSPFRQLKKLADWFKGKPNLRVHAEPRHAADDDDDDALEAEGDRILAKISTQGDGSLTAKERRTLEQYSRLMRDRRR